MRSVAREEGASRRPLRHLLLKAASCSESPSGIFDGGRSYTLYPLPAHCDFESRVTMAAKTLFTTWALAALAACAASFEKAAAVPDGWRKLDAEPDSSRHLQMSFALHHPATDELSDKLMAGMRLSLAQVTDMRTPKQQDVNAVLEWLADAGIKQTRAETDWVHARTTVGEAEKLLNMRLHQYSFDGKAPVLRTTEYSIPDDLNKIVSFVHPIANFMTPTHEVGLSKPLAFDQQVHQRDTYDCKTGIRPECIIKQYNISYTPPNGTSHVRFGIAGFLEQYANFADAQIFFERYKPELKGYNFSVELVNGGKNLQTSALSGLEAALDVEYGMAIGHPTQVTFYSVGGHGMKLNASGKPYPNEYSDNEPYLDLLEHLLSKPDSQLPHVLSISYADDEPTVPRAYAVKVCTMFGLLAARGVSVIFGAGDGGSAGGRNATCRANDGTNREMTIATFPPSCPWVTAMGAVTNKEGPPPGAEFSSGGFSQFFDRPWWQTGVVEEYVRQLDGHLSGYYNPSMRALPDISVVGTQYTTVIDGRPVQVDGTSASAPVFAAMIALINDARLRKGRRSLGWLNKRLYSEKVRNVLNDTTEGLSRSCVFSGDKKPGGWPAKKGWDAITGLGTPGSFGDLLGVLVKD
ncbi:Tripeptidyl-peptidase I [Purpureocillium takamizusanense]|uniref:tripeptidyl-peptidase II n=1 Tax=Purpureocillium takamizusanense TaxID=2060973 RepID=A0A9Q8QAW9_9HYPO|nr:Tripeptidyl-peptidase I [Purpureocillium takamizusanense]UNI15883.1 Tripeptidyl-peptidase I [Purpureocillium takamizusanense]